jgi:hypothetical protein
MRVSRRPRMRRRTLDAGADADAGVVFSSVAFGNGCSPTIAWTLGAQREIAHMTVEEAQGERGRLLR